MKLMNTYMERRAAADAKNKYYEQEMTLKVQRWTESLYQDIRTITAQVAQARGVDIVLATEELSFPAASVRDLLLSIKTDKVLYNNSDLDITDEVLAQLDATM
jgi:Skp family chaperone for outer membrane proteins